MSLPIGTKLGPYEILAPAGAGGMGEVYKAQDTRLDRVVAVKVLPQELEQDAKVGQRFDREAQAISQLNHPHICTLYDVGDQDGTRYLVMEYLEGDTLAALSSKGALPLDLALEYALQMGDALDKAHRAGIVHRDLKPANVIVQGSGVKLLDFGLAKLVAGDRVDEADSDAATAQQPLTQENTILGTLQYMAPEQLEGKAVDARADVFAFGAVLYEMLTGRRAFAGDSQAGLMSAILRSPVDPLPETLPRSLDRFVSKCLEKSREDRWQTARELVTEIEWILAEPEPVTHVTTEPGRGRGGFVWLFAGLLVGAVVAGLATPRRELGPDTTEVTRLVVPLPAGQELVDRRASPIALSPNGRRLVYAATLGDDTPRLYRRDLDAFVSTAIPGTEGGHSPFFSPDGDWVGFLTDSELKKVPLDGSEPTPLAVVTPTNLGGSWTGDDVIVYSPRGGGGSLWRIDASGGTPEELAIELFGTGIASQPQVLPDNDSVILRNRVASMSSRESVNIDVGYAEAPVFVPTGHLLVLTGSAALSATPFDFRTRTTGDRRVQVLTDVASSGGDTTGNRRAYVATSATGDLAYVSGTPDKEFLVRVDRNGVAERIIEGAGLHLPRLSPNGASIAWDARGNVINVLDVSRGTVTELRNSFSFVIWARDSNDLLLGGLEEEGFGLLTLRADGGGSKQRIRSSEFMNTPTSVTENGRIAFNRNGQGNRSDLWVLDADGTATEFLATPADEHSAVFSPDGRYLAYQSDASGSREIYVRPFPAGDARWKISANGGTAPVWSPVGGELFFREAQYLMVVDVTTGDDFSAGAPRRLFEQTYVADGTGHPGYDVASDGQSFIMIQQVREAPLTEIHIVLNWFDELERLVPPEG